jgi:hypothetical protein
MLTLLMLMMMLMLIDGRIEGRNSGMKLLLCVVAVGTTTLHKVRINMNAPSLPYSVSIL